jgi:TPR repeat protein
MNKIQVLLTTTVLLFGISGSGVADFKDGTDAYRKGDYKTALNEWKPLAEQGDVFAQHLLGLVYTLDEGVLVDFKEAIRWYRKAAEKDYAPSQFKLAALYLHGKGVLRDDIEGVKWLLKAAVQDYAKAQYALGGLYANGIGVSKDLSRAKYWIKKAYENPDIETSTKELAEKSWNEFELWQY